MSPDIFTPADIVPASRCACCATFLPNFKAIFCPDRGPSRTYCEACAPKEIGWLFESIADGRSYVAAFLHEWRQREQLRDDLYRATMKDGASDPDAVTADYDVVTD